MRNYYMLQHYHNFYVTHNRILLIFLKLKNLVTYRVKVNRNNEHVVVLIKIKTKPIINIRINQYNVNDILIII